MVRFVEFGLLSISVSMLLVKFVLNTGKYQKKIEAYHSIFHIYHVYLNIRLISLTRRYVDIPLCVLRPVTIKKNNKTIRLKSVNCEAFNAGFFPLIDKNML